MMNGISPPAPHIGPSHQPASEGLVPASADASFAAAVILGDLASAAKAMDGFLDAAGKDAGCDGEVESMFFVQMEEGAAQIQRTSLLRMLCAEAAHPLDGGMDLTHRAIEQSLGKVVASTTISQAAKLRILLGEEQGSPEHLPAAKLAWVRDNPGLAAAILLAILEPRTADPAAQLALLDGMELSVDAVLVDLRGTDWGDNLARRLSDAHQQTRKRAHEEIAADALRSGRRERVAIAGFTGAGFWACGDAAQSQVLCCTRDKVEGLDNWLAAARDGQDELFHVYAIPSSDVMPSWGYAKGIWS